MSQLEREQLMESGGYRSGKSEYLTRHIRRPHNKEFSWVRKCKFIWEPREVGGGGGLTGRN